MPTTTAAGRSKSPNDHISNELLQYAKDLKDFNDSHHIDGIASTVPLTIQYAARKIKEVSTQKKHGLFVEMKSHLLTLVFTPTI
jgi:hypothetical protein